MKIAIAEAKARFAALIRRAEAGEDVELTRYGRPVARIVGLKPQKKIPLFGCMKGRIHIADDFDEMPAEFWASLSAPVEPQ